MHILAECWMDNCYNKYSYETEAGDKYYHQYNQRLKNKSDVMKKISY